MEPSQNAMTLYHVNCFCSAIPAQLADELAIPETELVVKTIADPSLLTKDPVLQRISPRGVVPVLALPDGSIICEAGAIALYLCEVFDKSELMHPPVGSPTRARFLQGVIYCVAECYRPAVNVFFECYDIKKKDRDYTAIKQHSEKFQKIVVEHLARELGDDRQYYLGEKISLCDIMFGWILMLASLTEENLITNDAVQQYFGRLASRPSFKKYCSPP
jgi:glutathione S-transferase